MKPMHQYIINLLLLFGILVLIGEMIFSPLIFVYTSLFFTYPITMNDLSTNPIGIYLLLLSLSTLICYPIYFIKFGLEANRLKKSHRFKDAYSQLFLPYLQIIFLLIYFYPNF